MTTVAIVLIVSVLMFAVLGIPLAWSLGLASLCAIATTGNLSIGMLAQRMYTGGAVYAFLAIFFFVFAGNIMTYGGLSRRLVNFANGLVGHIRGGTSIVCMLACTFFAAISGSSIATTAAIGGMLYPELKKYGYPDDYAATLPAVGGVLGIVIPPSVTFIVYGTTVNVSVGKLLFSGVVPGILGGAALSVLCWYFARTRNYPKGEKVKLKEFLPVAKDAFPALLTPLIILGGIYSGLFTPTESAAVATVYSLFATKFIYKELDWETYKRAMRDTTQTTANILILVMAATCFSWLLTVNNVPNMLSALLLSVVHSKAAFFAGTILLLVFLGMFMDVSVIILIIAPLLAPVAYKFGIDPVHYGCIFVYTLAIGQATPPFGSCLFVSSSMSGHGIMKLGKLAIPFVATLIAVVVLTCLIPGLATVLPNHMIT